MTKKKLNLFPLIVQGIHFAFFLFETFFCLIYGSVESQSLREILSIPVMLFFLPTVLPWGFAVISFAFNIVEVYTCYKERTRKFFLWLAWTVLSLIIYAVCAMYSAHIFVSVTGGV